MVLILKKGEKMKIKINIEVDVDKKGEYTIFGKNTHICEEHKEDVKKCFLDELVFLFEHYALENDKKLTKNSQALKQKILNSVTVVND